MRKGRVAISVLGGAAAISVLFALFAPEDRVASAAHLVRRLIDHRAYQCSELAKSIIRDPDSFRLVSSREHDEHMLLIEYRSRNGYGGVVAGDLDCGFQDGALSLQRTVKYHLELVDLARQRDDHKLANSILDRANQIDTAWHARK